MYSDASRFACVAGLGPRGDLRFHVNFFRGVTSDLIVIEKMRERAVVSATIVLILFGRDWR